MKVGETVPTAKGNAKIIKKEAICTDAHWALLLKPITDAEIKAAIFSIPEHKSPGPDGYSSAFYKDSWSIIGDEVCNAIKDVFRSGKLLRQLNATILTLIPKCRLKKNDCVILNNKIVDRIRSLGAKNLSYAGRLVLVSSVLSTMHNYWAPMFVLPKGVLQRVDNICRNFLWEGSSEYGKVPSVGWQKVCVQKQEGGLGLKQSHVWNITMVGKLVWWIDVQPDRLWVQWVNLVYLKGSNWLEYNPSSDCYWYWRKICGVRDNMIEGFVEGQWSHNSGVYTVKGCYQWLRLKRDRVDWYRKIRCPIVIPKHNFIAWTIADQAFKLKDRLVQYGVSKDDLCCICQMHTETHHLFVKCQFRQELLHIVGEWLGTDISKEGSIITHARRRWSKLRKSISTTIVLTCWYFIWMQRNKSRLHQCISRPNIVAKHLQEVIRSRLFHCKPVCISQKDVN
ncbi:uncharacterized protein LOC141595438 [Silene latifolia]|uniref:uncharacterized protein LOC141595438 n=1 Tax=Silene latifolia TaxID=37657 RepID=UPI003D784324